MSILQSIRQSISSTLNRVIGLALPPVLDNLLVWLTGTSTDTEKLDKHKDPNTENFTMSQSHCVTLNGVNEYGQCSTLKWSTFDNDIKVEIYIYSQTVDLNNFFYGCRDYDDGGFYIARNASSFALTTITTGSGNGETCICEDVDTGFTTDIFGKFSVRFVSIPNTNTYYCFISFGDSEEYAINSGNPVAMDIPIAYVQAFGSRQSDFPYEGPMCSAKLYEGDELIAHFRMSEGLGLTSFSDDGLHSIVWTGVEVNLWSQRQDEYHGNSINGWWEINGDNVKYPYPVVGFDIYHAGGTFNDCETSYGPEETPLGTMNVGDIITVSLKPGETITSILVDGSCAAVVDTITNEITVTVAGTIRNIDVFGTQDTVNLEMTDNLEMNDNLEML